MLKTRFRSPVALFALALGVAACNGALESRQPAPHRWWLEPPPLTLETPAYRQATLVVTLDVVPGLDTDRVLNLSPDHRLNHFAGAHWADNAPELIGSLLRRSLNNSTAFAAVTLHHGAASKTCRLDLEVDAFHARIDAEGVAYAVEVGWQGQFECAGVRRSVRVESSQPAQGNRMAGLVSAFQAALNQSAATLAGQLEG